VQYLKIRFKPIPSLKLSWF